MRILFVVPAPGGSKEVQAFPLGVLSIATYLKRAGHEVYIYDRSVSKENLKALLEDFKPDIAGFSITIATMLKDAIFFSKKLKKYNIPVTWGGVIPTLMKTEIMLNESYVDYVSFGEGEYTWSELLEYMQGKMKLCEIKGLAYKENGKIIKNEEREFADLAQMPMLDWSLIKMEKYRYEYMSCNSVGYIYSSKGCPCRCKFCCNKPLEHCQYRVRPIDYVTEEITELYDKYGFDGFYFMDEIWIASHNDVIDRCQAIKDINRDLKWGCMFKVGVANAEDYKIMADSGCRWILFGIESGSPSLHKKMNKGLPFGKIEQSVRDAATAGIRPITSFILGYVDETESEIRETIELVKKLIGYAIVPCNFFTPLIGSEAYTELVSSGRLVEPSKLKDYKPGTFDFMGENYSSIPDRDIKVIRSVLWFWSYLSDNKEIGGSSNKNAFASSISSVFKSMFAGGIKNTFHHFTYSVALASSVIFNYTCFPKIRRKYGLYLDKNKKK